MPKSNQLTSYIAGAKNGDQASFSALLDLYWDEVLGYHLKRNVNENDAEDICIQTFAKAFSKIDTFNESYTFKTWLIAISKNEYVDFLRKKNATYKIDIQQTTHLDDIELADDSLSQEDELIRKQNLSSLLKCIKKLKPQYRKIIMLRYFQEYTYKEIARETQETVSNVKVQLLRAKKLLAQQIQQNRYAR